MKYTKRFIEETFPVKEVSIISAKEKNIKNGHISTLHIWWARRPLAASRSTAFASLIPFPEDEETINYFWTILNPLFNKGILPKEKKTKSIVDAIKTFIIEMSRWENSNNKDIVEAARKMILHFNDGVPPKVLDPFGGGGSIPLECLRLGCETYSNDLNPVAVLIQKCTLEYPQKYGKPGYVERSEIPLSGIEKEELFSKGVSGKKKQKVWVENVLLEDVKYWGNWVYEEAKKELSQFYPPNPDGSIPVGYIWARTIPCQNPACAIEIPLIKSFWISQKENVALYPKVSKSKLEFKIIGNSYESFPEDFNPSVGTIKNAVVRCPKCNNTIEGNNTRKIFQKGLANDRLIYIVSLDKKSKRNYRLSNSKDYDLYLSVKNYLEKRASELHLLWGIYPIPDEELVKTGGNQMAVLHYGMNLFGDLFNSRQILSVIVFIDKLRSLHTDYQDENYLQSIITYLAFGINRLATHLTKLTRWRSDALSFERSFDRQALSMVWDYGEVNPFSSMRGKWDIEPILGVIKNCSQNSNFNLGHAHIGQESAIQLRFDNDSLDAVFTDPPYYDNIYYSNLSDFFYVIYKRSIGLLYPSLFTSELTPKSQEIVSDPIRHKEKKDAKLFFERMLGKAFKEVFRVLKNGKMMILVYAHKSTSGWETLINSLIESGLIVTSAWPIRTEMVGKLNAQENASLMSSIYISCRKIDRQPTAFYNDVKEETKTFLGKKLDRLWNEGISGTDFFIAAIGSSIEVFGKYEKVMDYEGNVIRANRLLEDVRIIVTDYAVKKILHNGFATGISELTRYYVLCRWEFKAAKIPFDEANKLAHSCHIELEDYWQKKTFIKKDKEFVQILGPQDRDIDDLKDSGELIDVLHYAIKLWEKGKKAEMQKVLNESGYAKSDSFFRVAQAIAETLPNESKEKKLLEGFLNLREKISESFKSEEKEKDLFD